MRASVRLMAMVSGIALLGCASAWADTFNFYFDNQGFTSPLVPIQPVVGTGTLSISTSLPDGLYTLASLPAYTLSFSFIDGETYSQTDMVSDPTQTEVLLYGGGTSALFTDLVPQPPIGGSLNLINGSGALLSFSPDFAVGFYVEGAGSLPGPTFEGNYGNVVVPEPSTLMLLSCAGLVAGIVRKHR